MKNPQSDNQQDTEWLSSELAATDNPPLRLPERDLSPQWSDLRLSLGSLMMLITGICVLAGSLRIIPRPMWIAIGEIAVFLGMVVLLACAILVVSLTFVFLVVGVVWLLWTLCVLPLRLAKS